ncbi:MAG: hypothetical protein WBQ08_22565 [Candidatus Sulfotelmatobacter sp.]
MPRLPLALRWCVLRLIPTLILLASVALADSAAFDLPGPRIEVRVTRGGKTLPISEVPELQPGDRLWLHAEIAANQSVHYLLIAAFLRGSTNPPPEQWFVKAETWNRQVQQEGTVVTVPEGAQQALLFLAPETGGDFATLRSAVRGRPGAFVRASQDLDQAALDRSRLDAYLAGIKETADADPNVLKERSRILARSLKIKVDDQCFDKLTEEQAPCLMRNPDQLVLDDGHSQSMVAVLTSGPGADLIGAMSTSTIAGGGAYSPYVGSVIDVVRMMENFHTAAYQYIPALALPKRDALDLKLNNPPSFHRPMSVLVAGLPAVEAAQFPPLRAVEPKQVFCLQRSGLELPVDGAPLVFSTSYLHDVVLHVQTKAGLAIDLPATADAARGGFLIDGHLLRAGQLDAGVTGTLRGYWGFQAFDGPAFQLQSPHAVKWVLASEDSNALIVGRQDAFHLQSEIAPCVDQVTMKDQRGKLLKATWKLLKTNELEVEVPLKDESAGPVLTLVAQSGLSKPDEVPLQTYSEAAHLAHFELSAGDQQGVLTGTRLDEVAGLELNAIHFAPGSLSRTDGNDQLQLSAASAAATAALKASEKLVAHVALKDGRVLDLDTVVEPPRPRVTLLSRSVQSGSTVSVIRLGSPDDLPQDGQISFFLKTDVPATFPRAEKIEVATDDGSADISLSLADGSLVLEDSQTVLGTLRPLKSFGPSVFGALRLRAVSENGERGDWQPLAKLVRIPSLEEVRCPDSPDQPCSLIGENLFLIDSVAADSQFAHNIVVPVGFADSALSVPRPNGTLLYIKLRDDPSTVTKAALRVLPEP